MTIGEIIAKYDTAPLECDGMTRVLFSEFIREGHSCEPYLGMVDFGKRRVNPHMWLRIPEGKLVDIRIRMYLGDSAPHGAFRPEDYPDFKYDGIRVFLDSIPPEIIDVMIMPFPKELIEKLKT